MNPLRRHWALTTAIILGLLTSMAQAVADLDIRPAGNWPGPLRSFNRGAVAVSGQHAFVTRAGEGLHVFDAGKAGPPQPVGFLPTAAQTAEIAIAGHLACVTDTQGRMLLVDISEPTQPRLASVFDTAGYVDAIGATGSHAYLAVSSAKTPVVQIVDISLSAQPRLVGTYASTVLAAGERIRTVAVNGQYLCIVGGRWDGTNDIATLEVVNVQDPANPLTVALREVVGRVDDANGGVLGLTVADGKVYFATLTIGTTWRSKIEIVDLRDSSGLKLLGSYTSTGVFDSLAVAGEFLYAARYSYVLPYRGAIDIIQVSDPSLPVRVSGVTTTSTEPGGPPTDMNPRLALGQGVVCLATSAELRSFDLSDPAVLRPLGTLTLAQWTADVAVSGHHAFTADIYGLSVLDVTDPANLTRIGKINATYPADRVVVSGNYAYLAGSKGLFTFDVSDPAAPRRTSTYSAQATDLAISGKLLLVVGYDGFHILDLTNPATPRRIGYHDTQYTPYQIATSVACSGNRAFVASYDYMSHESVLEVFDVSTPSAPQLEGSYNKTGVDPQITVSDRLAILTLRDWSPDLTVVEILDVSQPSAPNLTSSYLPDGRFLQRPKVSLVGNRAFVPVDSGQGLGVEVIDLSEPSRPRRIGGLNSAGRAFAVSGDTLFASDPGVQTFRLADADLKLSAIAELSGRASGVVLEGSVAYVAAGTAGLQVLDVGNPNQASFLGSFSVAGTAWSLAIADHRAYVGAAEAGLVVLDVSNPQASRTIGAYDTPGDARAVLISGNISYVADGGEGVQILDVSDPAHVLRLGSQATTGWAAGLAKNGNHLLVACREAGLAVLDVRNPADPQQVSTYNPGGQILAVAVAGSHALISDGLEGLAVLDLTNPAAPLKVGAAPGDHGSANEIAVSGRFAYVAVAQSGVEVYDLANPTRPRRVGGNSALPAFRLASSGNRLFVASGQRGMGVFELFAPPLRLGISPVQGAGTVNLLVDGPPGSTARLQRSTDLHTWSDWRSVTLGEFPQTLADETVDTQMRSFYRAVTP